MMKILLNVIVLGSLAGTFIVFAPAPEPRSTPPRPTTPNVATAPLPVVPASATVTSQQPPIPLVRASRATPSTQTVLEARASEPDAQPQDGLDKTGARTAIEADGYKNVTVLGRSADGTWRAKAFRGKTELQLNVDGTGRVSAE